MTRVGKVAFDDNGILAIHNENIPRARPVVVTMNRSAWILSIIILASCLSTIMAEPPKLATVLDDENGLGSEFWVYNDIQVAMKEARQQNKPLFVTFRCVPCEDCRAFDAEVAKESDIIRELAVKHFIPVRQVEMKGVDLSLFQFDYDLNWAAMFINADGVVYARYGTQSAAGADAYNSVKGLRQTMLRVLELHKGYPGNQAELRDKRGPRLPYKTALEMPGLENKQRFVGETTRKNCIHCHNIHDAQNNQYSKAGNLLSEKIWRYPLPENIGLVVDGNDGRRIKKVLAGTSAAASGLATGESITHVNGQAITSIADIQWVLHQLPYDTRSVQVTGSQAGVKTLVLGTGWKKTDISWRGSIWSVSPRLRVWTPQATAAEIKKLGLDGETAALKVKWINRNSPGGRSAYESGLREGDFVIRLDGKAIEMTPAQFNVHLKLNYKVGERLPLTVVRGDRQLKLELKLVE
jgi:hypothetical protein